TCNALKTQQLVAWCAQWVSTQHGKQLTAAAARLLVDLVGGEMGLLAQELTKLAIYIGEGKRIDVADVDKLVGNSRTADTWKNFDAIGSGRMAEGLGILDRLLEQGENPIGILGAMSWQLRKLAQAARLNQQGAPLGHALAQAGFKPYAQSSCEQQLRRLGRRRLDRLYDW